ncbi:hypothetical protein BOO69_14940 [Sulfitobacter alexandrii]|uniref:FAD-binding FR-type domain-containing protein n=1 Tax=Sulfitobacter alexandrii TaxID=1917485 RepID=A0A1J0WJR3_9RHOB|nr:siderophore-interacting protein [Sulfitobacter alexandrii]APE44564.1 hypothetical protein BOO69_14940 [Sulfitobacter alexandrii]
MTFPAVTSATFMGPLPADLPARVCSRAREADIDTARSGNTITLELSHARARLEPSPDGLRVELAATDVNTLQSIRDFLLHLMDHVAPGAALSRGWSDGTTRRRRPANFCTATLRGVRRIAPRFLRVEMACADTARLAAGRGMHFALLLPPAGRVPVWPMLDASGRTVMPGGDDTLHRAPYTFVDLDAASGTFSFDVFEHDGGRTTTWARTAKPGAVVGLSGPGSGDFPPGRNVLMAGDETALPAIRRILAESPAERQGTVILEVGTEQDITPLPRPEGVALSWLVRARGETLWDKLSLADPPVGPDRFVWIAAEKELIRKAKARFCGDLGVGRAEGYFAYYWER